MKTIQMTLDDDLVHAVDRVTKQMKTSRSAFTRIALREAVKKYEVRRLEEKHQKGYTRHPAEADEFLIWEDEQVWEDR
jgi:metal-responsive CopG/Arc/MetJ family transcriptional regulator